MRKSIVLSTLLAFGCYLTEAKSYDTKVVILGGGVSGISAALNLTANGIDDIIMVEARDTLGGKLYIIQSFFFIIITNVLNTFSPSPFSFFSFISPLQAEPKMFLLQM